MAERWRDPVGDERRARVVGALERSHGDVYAAARELGVPKSTLGSRIDALGLRPLVAQLRPEKWWRRPSARSDIVAALERHGGKVTRVARELGLQNDSLVNHIRRFQLEGTLGEIRARAEEQRRREIAGVLEAHGGNVAGAARALDLSAFGLRKVMDRLQMRPIVARIRQAR